MNCKLVDTNLYGTLHLSMKLWQWFICRIHGSLVWNHIKLDKNIAKRIRCYTECSQTGEDNEFIHVCSWKQYMHKLESFNDLH